MPLNPYESTPSISSSSDAALADADEHALLAHFAQSPYYVSKWATLQRSGWQLSSFNPAAALFSLPWCFYRKQYLLGLFLLLAEVGIGFVAGLLWALLLKNVASINALYWTGFVIMRIVFGAAANSLYYRRAKKSSPSIAPCRCPPKS
jgi:hypothetical protein